MGSAGTDSAGQLGLGEGAGVAQMSKHTRFREIDVQIGE